MPHAIVQCDVSKEVKKNNTGCPLSKILQYQNPKRWFVVEVT